jgi:ABC-type sugar transport system, periplasmic component
MKKIALLLVAVMVLTSMIGCANKDTGTEATIEESSEEGGSGGSKIVLAIWDTIQEPGLREICDDFTAETGIEVNIQVTPWEQYWTMLEAGATGDALPDVFWMHVREFGKYAEADMLMNLDERIAASDKIDLNNYFEDVTEVYSWENSQYAIPKDIDSVALWYNKTHFDEAGVDYPTDDWTWEDMKEAAAKLSEGDTYGTASRIMSNQELWYNTVYSLEGYIINDDQTKSGYDDPKTIEGIRYWADLVLDGYSPDNSVTSENDLVALFESGTISMSLTGSWIVNEFMKNEYVREHAGVAMIPKSQEGKRVSIYNGLGYAASATTPNQDEAWALVEYLGSKEAQEKQAELGITLSAYKGASDGWADSAEGFDLSPYSKVMEDTLVFFPHSKDTTKWLEMSWESLVKAWNGDEDVEVVCKEIAEKMNLMLEEE